MIRMFQHRRLILAAIVIVTFMAVTFAIRRSATSSAQPEEPRLVIKGRPVFLSGGSDGSVIAYVDQDPQKRHFPWPQQTLEAGSLPAMGNFCFTFFECPDGHLWPLELARVENDSGTLYESSVCELHREAMHRTRVLAQASSQEISPTPAIERMLFPHSGLVVTRTPGRQEMPVWICESCRRERDRWLDKARRSASAAN